MKKYTNVDIEGFLSLKKFSTELTQINAIVGPVGAGKSSVIEAIRTVIKGKPVRKSIINNFSDKAVISITDEEGNVTSRTFKNGLKGLEHVVRYNGKVTTQKLMDELITEEDEKAFELLTNPNSFLEMDKKAKSDFILKNMCFGVKLSLDKLREISGLDEKSIMELKKSISNPESITVSELGKIYDSLFSERAALKKLLDELKAKSIYEGSIPKRTLSEAQAALSEISKKEAVYASALKAVKDYEEKIKNLNALKEELKTMECPSSSLEDIELFLNLIMDSQNLLISSNSELKGTLSQNEINLNLLKGDKCPLNEAIICLSTERAKMSEEITKKNSELSEKIAANEEAIQKNHSEILLYEAQVKQFNIFNSKSSTIKALEENITKPEDVKEEDFEAAKIIIKEEMISLTAYENSLKAKKEYEEKKIRFDLIEGIMAKIKPKSSTMDAIGRFMVAKPLEIINETAAELALGFQVEFNFQDGVEINMVTEEKGAVNFDSLSGGEQILVSYLLFDFINQLYGNGMMILDNLDRLDAKSFARLIEVIQLKFFSDKYSIVLLSLINHPDLLEVLNGTGINVINM